MSEKEPLHIADDDVAGFIVVTVVVFVLLLIFRALIQRAIKIVRHSEVMIVERFGR